MFEMCQFTHNLTSHSVYIILLHSVSFNSVVISGMAITTKIARDPKKTNEINSLPWGNGGKNV